MASSLTLPRASAASSIGAGGRTRRRALALALVLSLGLHVGVTLWPVEPPETTEPTVLTATITEMPPPPVLAPSPPAATPKPRARRALAPLAPEPPRVVTPDLADLAPAVELPAETPATADAAPVLAEETAPAHPTAPPPSIRTLPARVELAYRVYYGLGLYIGDASYRFEHANGRYRIVTVGEARGLAALVLRGQGKVEVRGLITPAGLQPFELAVERGSRDRREQATFDWESGIATLHDDKTAALELPSYDPLSLMWQFYFSPPTADRQAFHVVTTRRVMKLEGNREGTDTVSWPYGEVQAERWHRTSEDGKTESVVWLAPSLRYLPIKMRVTNTLRGTLEVVLAAIRVDDEGRVE